MRARWVLCWSLLSIACAEGLASVTEDEPTSRPGDASGGAAGGTSGGAATAAGGSDAGTSGAGKAAAGAGSSAAGTSGASAGKAAGGAGASAAGTSGASAGKASAGSAGTGAGGAAGTGAGGAAVAGAAGAGGAGQAGGGGASGGGEAGSSGGDSCNPDIVFDFEAGAQGFVHAPTSGIAGDDPWAYGAPSGLGCHGGTKCWATSLSGGYGNCDTAELRSVAIDLSACASSSKQVTLKFWHRYAFEPKSSGRWFDGGLVQVSPDDGKTWSDVAPTPAYDGAIDGAYSGCDPKPEVGGHLGWSGAIAGNAWAEVSVDLPPMFRVAALRVRWLFGADEATNKRGWGIDDVSITAQ